MASSRKRSNTSLNQETNAPASDLQSDSPNLSSRQNGSDDSTRAIYKGKMRKIESSSDIPERRAQRTQVLRKRKSFASFARFAQVANRIVSRVRKTEYVYSPLTDLDDIRLLVIRPADKTSHPLYCELVLSTNKPDPLHPYEALSYMWGTEDATEEIKIFHPTLSGVFITAGPGPRRTLLGRLWASFFVRPNLYAALVHLRDKKKNVVVWVDALCIDQTNIAERSEQVTKMADIYNRATNVCVWLGSGNLRSQLALQFIPKLLQNMNLVRDDSSSSHWSALAELMRNQWFSRRWVVQEVALAKLATLHCGQDIVDWGDFADAVALFVAKFDTIHKLARKSHEPLGNVRAGAYNLVAVINDYLRKSKDDKVERLETLEILVSRLLSFDATDPRDTIYAVLSLAKDTVEGNPDNASQDNALLFVPDYKKSEVDVFKDFIEFAIKSSESLDIICRHWAPVIKEKDSPPTPQHKRRKGDAPARKRLPSWIPSVSRSPYGSPEDALLGRVYGDSFVGTSERKTYNTAPKTIAIWRFGEEPTDLNSSSSPSHRNADSDGESRGSTGFASSPLPNPFTQQIGNSTGPERKSRSNGSMFAKGFRLDSIKELSARFVKGVIPRECLEMAGWITSDYDDKSDIPQVPDELWRTMVADRDSKANNPPPYYQRACQNCLAGSLRGDIEITKMIDDEQDDMTIEFLKRVESVIWNRKFLKSAGKKYSGPRGNLVPKQLFGLAPDLAREKDIICILLGCSVPVILREHRKPKRHFELIGEAYIYGMMGGEALGGRKMEELKKQCEEFELR